MYLEISNKLLGKKTIFEYIGNAISKNFPDTQEDVDKINNAKSIKDVESVFNDYYEGWLCDGAKFYFGDIDTLLYWFEQEVELVKKSLENKKYIEKLQSYGISLERKQNRSIKRV